MTDEELIGRAKARGIHDAEAALDFGRAVEAETVIAERQRICAKLPGGDHVDPQWVADMVRSG